MTPLRFSLADRRPRGFTLVELLTVIAVISVLVALTGPALNALKGATDITRSADEVAELIQGARSYAIAHNTYVWIGLFEEDASSGSATPATSGTGRVIFSVVASKDGSAVYDPSSTANPDPLNPAKLVQVTKLLKLEGVHLAAFPKGDGTGSTFDARPAVTSDNARIGGAYPQKATQFPFTYPIRTAAAAAQYNFSKTLQFNPRGEVVVNSTNSLEPLIEAGLQRTRGSTVDTVSRNVIAIQVTGIAGNVAIYRR